MVRAPWFHANAWSVLIVETYDGFYGFILDGVLLSWLSSCEEQYMYLTISHGLGFSHLHQSRQCFDFPPFHAVLGA